MLIANIIITILAGMIFIGITGMTISAIGDFIWEASNLNSECFFSLVFIALGLMADLLILGAVIWLWFQ